MINLANKAKNQAKKVINLVNKVRNQNNKVTNPVNKVKKLDKPAKDQVEVKDNLVLPEAHAQENVEQT